MIYSKIYEESSNLHSLDTDIDRTRIGYTVNDVDTDGNVVHVSFVSPYLNVLEKYRYFLYANSTMKPLGKKYHYRPDYISFDEYGTTNYWALILFINDIASIDEFTPDNILVPKLSALNLINNDQNDMLYKILEKTKFNQIENPGILYMPPVNNLVKTDDVSQLFNRTVSALKYVDKTLLDQVNNNASDLFVKEDFIMDIPTLRLRFVDLQFQAVANSIIVQVKNKKSVVYGKHYKLIENEDGEKRVTWDPKIITTGVGMVFFLKELDHIQISYMKKV